MQRLLRIGFKEPHGTTNCKNWWYQKDKKQTASKACASSFAHLYPLA